MNLADFSVMATGANGLVAMSMNGKPREGGRLYPYAAFLTSEQIQMIRTVHRMFKEEKGEEVKRITGCSDIVSFVSYMLDLVRKEAESLTTTRAGVI